MDSLTEGFAHYISVTLDGKRRTCLCGWHGDRKDDHPPMSISDAIATTTRDW